MKQYFYAVGTEQFGGFTLEELKDKKITRETLVWHEGLDGWVKAESLPELNVLFTVVPPPISQVHTEIKSPPALDKKATTVPKVPNDSPVDAAASAPKTNRMKVILIASGVIILLAILIPVIIKSVNNSSSNYTSSSSSNSNSSNSNSSNNNNGNNSSSSNYDEAAACDGSAACDDGRSYNDSKNEKSSEELAQELAVEEAKTPLNYLSVKYDLTYKVLSGKDKITGTIYNSASMAMFKDVKLRVEFLSNTNMRLDFEDFIVYEFIEAGSSANFTIQTYSPSGTKKIGVEVVGATPVTD